VVAVEISMEDLIEETVIVFPVVVAVDFLETKAKAVAATDRTPTVQDSCQILYL